MMIYSLHTDVSFVSDHDKLVVLNFETGEYFMTEGICMDILQILECQPHSWKELRKKLSNIYDLDLYDLDESLKQAMNLMISIGFVEGEESE